MVGSSRLLVAVAAVLVVWWVGAAPAAAHNVLTGSDPADGESVATGPEEVRLEFLASLDPDNADLSVTGPDGSSVMAADPEFDGSAITLPVDAAYTGDYVVNFEVLSADGHWVDGTVSFTVTEGEQPVATPTPAPESPAPASPPADAAEESDATFPPWGVVWMLPILGAGMLFFMITMHRKRRRSG